VVDVPEELWLPTRRLELLRVWRLARAGLDAPEIGGRLGMTEGAVQRALGELWRYGVRPAEADGDWEGRWVHCYYLPSEELERYKRARRAPLRIPD
jgi:predicted transcriptional regulator